MEKLLFLSSFRNLKIQDSIDGSFTLLPGINITNSIEKKVELITDDVASVIGIIETDFLMRAPNIIFCEFDEEVLAGPEIEPFLLAIILWISGLFRSAWVLSDHCFECDAAYIFSIGPKGISKSTSNYLAEKGSLADCTVNDTTLQISDLEKWRSLHHTIETYLHENDSSDLRFLMEKGYCRSGRAFQFIKSAKSARNCGYKIAHYISAFESLFSTSSSELSHKLSERVAFFLGEHGFERREVFCNMKAAYDVRSKLVHGDHLSPQKIESLIAISLACDSYLRAIMQLLFGENMLVELFDVSQAQLDKYFEEIIMG